MGLLLVAWADLAHPLTLSLLIDAFATVAILAWLFAVKPPGRVRWPWFVVFSLVGGLVFSVPFYLWLNRRLSGEPAGSVAAWWRSR